MIIGSVDNKQIIEKAKDKIISQLEVLKESWSYYNNEPFMQGKVEATDVAIKIINKILTEAMCEKDTTQDD